VKQLNKILFIGNYLSKIRGTVNPSEKLASLISNHYCIISLCSTKKYQIVRLIDIIISCVVLDVNVLKIDVFSGNAFIFSEISTIIAKIRKKKIILELHGGMLQDFHIKNKRRITYLFMRADLILTPSLYLLNYFNKVGFDIHYLPNSINLSNFKYNSIRTTKPKLLWVRAFSKIYKPELAVEILFHVKKRIPNVTLTMIGPDKGELSKVRKIINDYSLSDSVNITGPVSNESLLNYFHNHSVFLNTTLYESFGMAILESAACGVPIVSTPAGEIPILWQNNHNILIAENWESESLAKSVINLLSDDRLYEMIKINARIKAEEFDWDIIKSKWIEILS
jgi:glycosyltransferase involved in cell wall biosynthesis